MAFTAKDVLWSVQVALKDGDNARWTLEELRTYLNDGLKQIAALKPSACSRTSIIELDEGTYQELDAGQTLLRVIRNITSLVAATPRVAGPVITPIDRALLDQQYQDWHTASAVPFSATVAHVVHEEMNPRAFYVFPGNDGTGKIECIVSRIPDQIAAPADPHLLASYSAAVDIADLYQNVLRDYILARAFEKDSSTPGSAQRAQRHMQLFLSAVGTKQQVEDLANPNAD